MARPSDNDTRYDKKLIGFWAIYNADPNCDLHGPHIETFETVVHGRYESALAFAREKLPNFKAWDEGHLKLISIQEV